MVIFGWLEMASSTEGCWVMKTERRQLCATIPPALPPIYCVFLWILNGPLSIKKGKLRCISIKVIGSCCVVVWACIWCLALTHTQFSRPSDECSVITVAARPTLFLPLLCYDYSFLSVLSGRLTCVAAQGLADNWGANEPNRGPYAYSECTEIWATAQLKMRGILVNVVSGC